MSNYLRCSARRPTLPITDLHHTTNHHDPDAPVWPQRRDLQIAIVSSSSPNSIPPYCLARLPIVGNHIPHIQSLLICGLPILDVIVQQTRGSGQSWQRGAFRFLVVPSHAALDSSVVLRCDVDASQAASHFADVVPVAIEGNVQVGKPEGSRDVVEVDDGNAIGRIIEVGQHSAFVGTFSWSVSDRSNLDVMLVGFCLREDDEADLIVPVVRGSDIFVSEETRGRAAASRDAACLDAVVSVVCGVVHDLDTRRGGSQSINTASYIGVTICSSWTSDDIYYVVVNGDTVFNDLVLQLQCCGASIRPNESEDHSLFAQGKESIPTLSSRSDIEASCAEYSGGSGIHQVLLDA